MNRINGRTGEVLEERLESQGLSRRELMRILVAPVVLSAVGCGGAGGIRPSAQRSVAYRWMDLHITAITHSSLGPPVTARAVALVATAMYDAWAAYDGTALGTRTGDNLRRPSGSGPARTGSARSATPRTGCSLNSIPRKSRGLTD